MPTHPTPPHSLHPEPQPVGEHKVNPCTASVLTGAEEVAFSLGKPKMNYKKHHAEQQPSERCEAAGAHPVSARKPWLAYTIGQSGSEGSDSTKLCARRISGCCRLAGRLGAAHGPDIRRPTASSSAPAQRRSSSTAASTAARDRGRARARARTALRRAPAGQQLLQAPPLSLCRVLNCVAGFPHVHARACIARMLVSAPRTLRGSQREPAVCSAHRCCLPWPQPRPARSRRPARPGTPPQRRPRPSSASWSTDSRRECRLSGS